MIGSGWIRAAAHRLEESVRPCLRCDFLVDSLSHYCPRCGNYLDKLKLVLPRPAAAAPADDASRGAAFFALCAAVAFVAAVGCVAGAAWVILTPA